MPVACDLSQAWSWREPEPALLDAGDDCLYGDGGDDVLPLPHSRVWIVRIHALPSEADFVWNFATGFDEEFLHAADL